MGCGVFQHPARRACELAPQDTSLLKYLLFFAAIPDKLLPRNEEVATTERILESDPGNATALQHLNRTT